MEGRKESESWSTHLRRTHKQSSLLAGQVVSPRMRCHVHDRGPALTSHRMVIRCLGWESVLTCMLSAWGTCDSWRAHHSFLVPFMAVASFSAISLENPNSVP
jgi:hypothetical protein